VLKCNKITKISHEPLMTIIIGRGDDLVILLILRKSIISNDLCKL
jgi:hypothetical protein